MSGWVRLGPVDLIRSYLFRISQVRSGNDMLLDNIRLVEVKLGYVRIDQVRLGQVKSG
jgi:hypothetical protein